MWWTRTGKNGPAASDGAVPAGKLAALLEAVVSRRGLGLGFLAVALVFTLSGWLRPALSPDLLAVQLPLGGGRPAEELLYGPRPAELGGAGTLMLALIALAAVIVVARPERFSLAAGLILAGSLAGNAAVCWNHPFLIELLDREYEQHVSLVAYQHAVAAQEAVSQFKQNNLASTATGRIPHAPASKSELADLFRGWYYLLYGRWLVVVATVALLVGTPGSVGRRLLWLGLWSLVGIGLTGILAGQRLCAEYHWLRAVHLEQRADYAAARQALHRAVELFPEFDHLQRTWLLAGKLDYRLGDTTPSERFFQAHHLVLSTRDPVQHRALALLGDLGAERSDGHPAVRSEAASVRVQIGLDAVTRHEFTLADDAWSRVDDLEPWRLDCAAYLTTFRLRVGRKEPGLIDKAYGARFGRLADRVLRADLRAGLGDAYLEAGQPRRARACWQESLEIFSLPHQMNWNAEKGLGGL